MPSAVVIEASCTQIGVIHPCTEMDAICNANHFAAYPGFNGYKGHNLAKDQLKYRGSFRKTPTPWQNGRKLSAKRPISEPFPGSATKPTDSNARGSLKEYLGGVILEYRHQINSLNLLNC